MAKEDVTCLLSGADEPPMAMIWHNWKLGEDTCEHASGMYNVSRCWDVVKSYPARCVPYRLDILPYMIRNVWINDSIDRDYAARIPLHIATAKPLLSVELPDGEPML